MKLRVMPHLLLAISQPTHDVRARPPTGQGRAAKAAQGIQSRPAPPAASSRSSTARICAAAAVATTHSCRRPCLAVKPNRASKFASKPTSAATHEHFIPKALRPRHTWPQRCTVHTRPAGLRPAQASPAASPSAQFSGCGTTHGFTSQISLAYSAIVRSVLNLPLPAVIMMLMWSHLAGSL